MKLFQILLCLLLTSFSHLDGSTDKANVLVFFVDDLRPELGCYGVDSIKTPHIDKLASQGVLFERAYCQQAICGPSRISMLTGLYPYRSGIQDLWTTLSKSRPDAMSLPRYFQGQGYRTLSYGKVYHHHNDDRESWSDLPDVPGLKYADPEVLESIRIRSKEADSRGLSTLEKFHLTQGPAVESADVDDAVYIDGAVALQAMESLRRHSKKPFFMCVGFAKPHLPFAAPKRYWDMYDREQFSVPDRSLPEGAPTLAYTNWGELRAYQGMPKEGPLSDVQTKQLRHGYAASVSYADAQVGKVLEELDRLGLRENTIIVLWGDHGYKLGDHGLWCKHTNLELDTRIPLIVSVPGYAGGERSNSLVEIIDIFPTLIELTGGENPGTMDGRSLEPVLKDPNKAFRSHALSEYRRGNVVGFSLRNHRWRYTEWIDTGTRKVLSSELYDHKETALSKRNLVGQPEFADLVSALSQQLDAAGRCSENE